MRIKTAISALVITSLTLASTAQAGPGCGQDAGAVADHIFDASDTNQDGSLSPDEYADAGLERYGVSFEAFDTNDDGATSREEYLELFDRHHPPKGAIEI